MGNLILLIVLKTVQCIKWVMESLLCFVLFFLLCGIMWDPTTRDPMGGIHPAARDPRMESIPGVGVQSLNHWIGLVKVPWGA